MASKPDNTNTLTWIAIVLSVSALIVSLAVYSQNQGGFSMQEIQQEVRSLKQQAAFNKALQSMEELRREVASGSVAVTEVQSRITVIRNELSAGFVDASDAAKKSWQALDNVLADIGTNIRSGTVSVLDALDKAIVSLKNQIQN